MGGTDHEIRFAGGSADVNIIGYRVRTSVAERLPLAEIIIDDSAGYGLPSYGRYDDLEIKQGLKGGALGTIFKGMVEDINTEEEGVIRVIGRGYALIFAEQMIDQLAFASQTVYYIVNKIREMYGFYKDWVTPVIGNQIDSVTDVASRTFKGVSAWDAIMEMAFATGYDAWVDESKALHFHPRAWDAADETIDAADLVFEVSYDRKASKTVNRVIVFGDPDTGGGQPVGSADDWESQNEIGIVKSQLVLAPEMTTTAECDVRADEELHRMGVPERVEVVGVGWEALTVGSVVRVNLPDSGVPDANYYLLEKTHEMGGITRLVMHAYSHSTEDVILDIIKEIRAARAQDLDESIQSKIISVSETLALSCRVQIFAKSIGTTWRVGFNDFGSEIGLSSTHSVGFGYEGSESEIYDSEG